MKLIRGTLIAHIAAWLLFGTLVVGFVYRDPQAGRWVSGPLTASLLLFFAFFISVFYLNSLVLLPRLYLRRKYLLYSLACLSLILATYFLRPFDHLMTDVMQRRNNFRQTEGRFGPPPNEPGRNAPGIDSPQRVRPSEPDSNRRFEQPRMNRRQEPQQRRGRLDFAGTIMLVAVWSLSTALFIIRQWRKTEQRALLAEAEKAQAELSFLKAQINPHFLFNTLNNIYSLAISNNAGTADSILKLSNIMRYVTDDIREDFVPLEHEIACMRDYIDLQRLRLGSRMQVEFEVTGEPGSRRIVPLVLMTFIENVFKYGISNHDPSVIRISLAIEADALLFHCENKIYRNGNNSTRRGVGIANTRQRLELLYPAKHELQIREQDEQFIVDLKILS